MPMEFEISELPSPRLQFGGAGAYGDPKSGLAAAGPFDLRFGSARKTNIHVGIIGTEVQIAAARRWLERCDGTILAPGEPTLVRRAFPGFADAFHANLVSPDTSIVTLTSGEVSQALQGHAYRCFQRIVDIYSNAHQRLAAREVNRPDVVLVCIPEEILARVSVVERRTTEAERKRAKALERARSRNQLDFFDILDEVEETPEDFLKRDLRLALKACALRSRLPIQLATDALLLDGARNQDAATRAWNFSVGLYYKAGRCAVASPSDGLRDMLRWRELSLLPHNTARDCPIEPCAGVLKRRRGLCAPRRSRSNGAPSGAECSSLGGAGVQAWSKRVGRV